MQTMRAIHTVHMHARMSALHAYVTSFGPYTHMLHAYMHTDKHTQLVWALTDYVYQSACVYN